MTGDLGARLRLIRARSRMPHPSCSSTCRCEPDQVVAGAPTTGHLVLDDDGERMVGVWEMTVGAMRDVEADEVFVVLAGAATVEFEHPHAAPIVLAPGSVVRLESGMRDHLDRAADPAQGVRRAVSAETPSPTVVAVARDDAHRFSKPLRDEIRLVEGHGVEGDAHAGATVRRRSRFTGTWTEPNRRQVHLVQVELFDELAVEGHEVAPGELGENVTTAGVDLLALPLGTRIRLGDAAEVELTGLRNPCVQIERFQPGLMKRLIRRDAKGATHRRAGVMAIVVEGGVVRPGDPIIVVLPAEPHELLPVL